MKGSLNIKANSEKLFNCFLFRSQLNPSLVVGENWKKEATQTFQKQKCTNLYLTNVTNSTVKFSIGINMRVKNSSTIRKYTFNIGYLEHSTSVLKPMLKVTMLNV